ncbi:NADH-FMN oxidoreductase RutF, flavin reductase (DIM6/NTAB) family [Arthrobacter sp. ok909]|uniref:flavin reductase family protein n=1 Tax=Arthrobacter sp. ok909 TaxID=1761746 RepID=UPI00088538D1|nr:flavin reductase family protein [Arthrobacter sp. ok909]SDP43429.1 NADH-FMN oxidoreductase RutF, flavin reductase (DIM6/NTAB) family [Arthrobacter sp. ok909]
MSAPAIARPIDSQLYRAVMRHLPTGVAAVCSTDPATGAQNAMIVGTFASLSMEPALVTFSVMHTSTSWPRIAAAEQFGISLLAEDQEQVCRALSAKGEDKLSSVGWSESGWGTPHIHGSLAWFDCRIEQQFVAGDHVVVIASVLDMTPGEGAPLIFHGGRFGSFREVA